MKPFLWKIVICLVPVLIAGIIVWNAAQKYQRGEGGFKLGVDLVGGDILVYEVDESKPLPEGYKPEELAASLKRRIDPTDLYNVTIRPVGEKRVEIILPTGGGGGTVAGEQRRKFTSEEVQYIKGLIAQVGSLEFRILANNDKDDKEGIAETEKYYDGTHREELDRLAREGLPPPAPTTAHTLENGQRVTYSFVELGRQERTVLGLQNTQESDTNPNTNWQRVAAARKEYKTTVLPTMGGLLIFSRDCTNQKISEEERTKKKYDYFVLTRDPEPGKAITGKYLVSASETLDGAKPAVAFNFDQEGGVLFYDVTSKNTPQGSDRSEFRRYLAIVLDGQIMSAPSLNAAISTSGIITGNFTKKEIDTLVNILRSGALPATLKPQPVSENSMGATLGADTIRNGTFSVGLAFVAVLIFMIVYYRFAGLVACVALLANLLLTVGFMAAVNATFTLPGLAGLVLMLGMAVDANVLIYERLREERDRGASLALAIRNGYDRAFPTIIDTHLSSIFTAIVLYIVGNDQLKGFGISLTVGLIISLFTSLYMTRLLFDIWLANNWLHKLSMFRLLSRTNIDFMSIRYCWFTATIILTIFGISVFLLRGKNGLNIDFVGGTAYGGQLVEPMHIRDLRQLIERNLHERLAVQEVKQSDSEGLNFNITYQDGTEQKVRLAKPATAEEIKKHAGELPDWSLEQIFVSSDADSGGKSRYFTIRTSEREQDLVQVTIDRLLSRQKSDGDWTSLLKKTDMETPKVLKPGQEATLQFEDYASPNRVRSLFEREFQDERIAEPYELISEGDSKDQRYKAMKLIMRNPIDAGTFRKVLDRTREEFQARPLPERLENFDSQLAAETQLRAMYAILGSWGAILLYLWFRFGNWTFGMAAVLCLVHDLFFTLGIIALCHWLHEIPFFSQYLLIQDFKIDLPAIAALLTLVGYSVNDTIVVFDRIREVRGKNPELTPQMINDSVNQTLSRTILTALTIWLVVIVLYVFGGDGVHLFAFCMVVGVIIGTYSSIYVASPLLLIFGEGVKPSVGRDRPVPARAESATA